MITEDLIAYIQSQTRKNISKDIIVLRLIYVGWHPDDIDEAFRKLEPPKIEKISKPDSVLQNASVSLEKKPDPYRELPGARNPEAFKSVPIISIPKVESQKIIKPIFATSFSEANPKKADSPYYIPDNNILNDSIFSKAPVVPQNKPEVKEEPKKEEPKPVINFGVMNPKLVKVPSEKISPSVDIVKQDTLKTTNTEIPKIQNKLEIYNEELLPTLKPKIPLGEATLPKSASIVAPIEQNQASLFVKQASIHSKQKLEQLPSINSGKVSPSSSIPEGALLHSYPQIISSSKNIPTKNLNNKKIGKIFILIIALLLVGGTIYAFSSNLIKIPSLNLSFIKKDPKAMLINSPAALSALKSYKIKTTVNLSMPSFADITNGLANGQAVISNDRDFISLDASGMVNNDGQMSPVFDYLATVKSSLFQNAIVSDIKHVNNQIFVSTPDLSEFLGNNAPAKNVILVKKGQFNLIANLLPNSIQDKSSKVDFDKLISTELPSYMTSEIAPVFKEFVNSANVVKNTPEDIQGIPTYHYILSVDRQSTKKFLNEFASVFLTNLSDSDKLALSDSLGSATFDTFEVWIGRDDGNIHQYKFNLTAPLSKIIGLDDKGIAGETVTLSWQTTYYDFNVANTIVEPASYVSMEDFIKNIQDIKIKSLISSFKQVSSNMHNAIGSYGKRSNPTGSCVNPNPSSLFSPVGYPKGANDAVAGVSSLLNNLLGITNGSLACYSTPSAWAIAAPLSSDPNTSFCYDSTGSQKLLANPLSGTVCK